MTHRPRIVVALCATLILTAPVACSSESSESGGGASTQLRPFEVVLDWTPNTNHAGMYLAKQNGWYTDAGLDVTFLEPGESGSLSSLASGAADVAVSVQEELIPARAAQLPVRSIAAIIQHNTSSLVSLEADGIERPRDLEGATYGGYGGPLEQALLDQLVTCDGGDPSKVRSVDVGAADYRVGLERNQYDAVWIFDGWDGIRLRQEGVETNAISFREYGDCIPDWYTPLLATSEKVEKDRPEDLEAFMAATARGYQAAMADPSSAADALLEQAEDLDAELVRASADYLSTRYSDDPAEWGRQEGVVWEDFAAFLLDAGLIESPITADEAWTNNYLPEP